MSEVSIKSCHTCDSCVSAINKMRGPNVPINRVHSLYKSWYRLGKSVIVPVEDFKIVNLDNDIAQGRREKNSRIFNNRFICLLEQSHRISLLDFLRRVHQIVIKWAVLSIYLSNRYPYP